MKFVHTHQLGRLPNMFRDKYSTNNSRNKRNTHQTNTIHIPRPLNNHGKKALSYAGTALWNGHSDNVKSISSIRAFTKRTSNKIK